MKVLVFVKATPNSEKGIVTPSAQMTKMFEDMGKFNEQLVKAGIMQDADGLRPSSAGKRITFSDNGAPSVTDGPFAETKELVAGYWIWNVKSVEEAVEWAKRCPNPMPGEEGTLEIRPCYALEDFSDIAPKAEFEREARLRKQVARQKKNASPKSKGKAAPARGKAAKGKAKRKTSRARGK